MKKITEKLNSPAKIGIFALICILLIGAVSWVAISVGANINVNKAIGLNKSVSIALDDSGIDEKQTSDLQSKYGTYKGLAVYQISFEAEGFEYSYVVQASDGKIISSQKKSIKDENKDAEEEKDDEEGAVENENLGGQQSEGEQSGGEQSGEEQSGAQQLDPSPIGVNSAKSIALQHAGLSANQVDMETIKLEEDDGTEFYETDAFVAKTRLDRVKDKDYINVNLTYELDKLTKGNQQLGSGEWSYAKSGAATAFSFSSNSIIYFLNRRA